MANIATMRELKKILSFAAIMLLFTACADNAKNKPTDTLSSGTIDVAIDETYKPIIQQHISVFDSSFPEAHIQATYKPESECIKDFLDGKVKLVLVTRELSADEKKMLESKKIVTTSLPLAKDAIAIIVNKQAIDTAFSISMIKGILTGTYKNKYTVVFDAQGSSTVRYMLDSLIPGEQLGQNVFAAKGNDSVIKYIENNPNAIGFVGVSYASDYSDPDGLSFINSVRIAEILNDSLQKFYQPYQAYIATGEYPLTRNLYYIHRETYPGLATGFANFLGKERGQLIFKQSRLFPLRTNIVFRPAEVNQ